MFMDYCCCHFSPILGTDKIYYYAYICIDNLVYVQICIYLHALPFNLNIFFTAMLATRFMMSEEEELAQIIAEIQRQEELTNAMQALVRYSDCFECINHKSIRYYAILYNMKQYYTI